MRYDEGLRVRKTMIMPCLNASQTGGSGLSGQGYVIEVKDVKDKTSN